MNENPFYLKSNDLIRGLLKNSLMVKFDNYDPIDRTGLNEEIIQLIGQSYIRAILYGNMNNQSALNITEKVILPYVDTRSIYFSKLYGLDNDSQMIPYLSEIKDIPDIVIFRMKADQVQADLSMVTNYYYLGNTDNKCDLIFIHLFKHTLMNYYNDILKNQSLFQYKSASLFNQGSNWYLAIIFMGKRDPRELNIAMDKILLQTRMKIAELEEDKELYKIKESIFDYLTKKEKTLSERTLKVRTEIKLNRYLFDSDEKYTMEKINGEFNKIAILNKFDDLFLINTKKLSLQKNCSDEISFEDEGYILNKTIPTVVTNDTDYFHRNRKL